MDCLQELQVLEELENLWEDLLAEQVLPGYADVAIEPWRAQQSAQSNRRASCNATPSKNQCVEQRSRERSQHQSTEAQGAGYKAQHEKRRHLKACNTLQKNSSNRHLTTDGFQISQKEAVELLHRGRSPGRVRLFGIDQDKDQKASQHSQFHNNNKKQKLRNTRTDPHIQLNAASVPALAHPATNAGVGIQTQVQHFEDLRQLNNNQVARQSNQVFAPPLLSKFRVESVELVNAVQGASQPQGLADNFPCPDHSYSAYRPACNLPNIRERMQRAASMLQHTSARSCQEIGTPVSQLDTPMQAHSLPNNHRLTVDDKNTSTFSSDNIKPYSISPSERVVVPHSPSHPVQQSSSSPHQGQKHLQPHHYHDRSIDHPQIAAGGCITARDSIQANVPHATPKLNIFIANNGNVSWRTAADEQVTNMQGPVAVAASGAATLTDLCAVAEECLAECLDNTTCLSHTNHVLAADQNGDECSMRLRTHPSSDHCTAQAFNIPPAQQPMHGSMLPNHSLSQETTHASGLPSSHSSLSSQLLLMLHGPEFQLQHGWHSSQCNTCSMVGDGLDVSLQHKMLLGTAQDQGCASTSNGQHTHFPQAMVYGVQPGVMASTATYQDLQYCPAHTGKQALEDHTVSPPVNRSSAATFSDFPANAAGNRHTHGSCTSGVAMTRGHTNNNASSTIDDAKAAARRYQAILAASLHSLDARVKVAVDGVSAHHQTAEVTHACDPPTQPENLTSWCAVCEKNAEQQEPAATYKVAPVHTASNTETDHVLCAEASLSTCLDCGFYVTITQQPGAAVVTVEQTVSAVNMDLTGSTASTLQSDNNDTEETAPTECITNDRLVNASSTELQVVNQPSVMQEPQPHIEPAGTDNAQGMQASQVDNCCDRQPTARQDCVGVTNDNIGGASIVMPGSNSCRQKQVVSDKAVARETVCTASAVDTSPSEPLDAPVAELDTKAVVSTHTTSSKETRRKGLQAIEPLLSEIRAVKACLPPHMMAGFARTLADNPPVQGAPLPEAISQHLPSLQRLAELLQRMSAATTNNAQSSKAVSLKLHALHRDLTQWAEPVLGPLGMFDVPEPEQAPAGGKQTTPVTISQPTPHAETLPCMVVDGNCPGQAMQQPTQPGSDETFSFAAAGKCRPTTTSTTDNTSCKQGNSTVEPNSFKPSSDALHSHASQSMSTEAGTGAANTIPAVWFQAPQPTMCEQRAQVMPQQMGQQGAGLSLSEIAAAMNQRTLLAQRTVAATMAQHSALNSNTMSSMTGSQQGVLPACLTDVALLQQPSHMSLPAPGVPGNTMSAGINSHSQFSNTAKGQLDIDSGRKSDQQVKSKSGLKSKLSKLFKGLTC